MDEKRFLVLKKRVEGIKTELAIKESKKDDLSKMIYEKYGIAIADIRTRLTEIKKSLGVLEGRRESLGKMIEKKLEAYE